MSPTNDKNVSDPVGGQFQARLNESVSKNHTIFPGTRNVVLYMAQHHPRPAAGAAQQKPATWSPDTKIYAYYSEKTLSKATERFKPYPDSKKYHSRHGMCRDPSRAETFGPVKMSESLFACDKCLQFKCMECLVKQHAGTVRTVEVPRNKGVKVTVTQSAVLPAFVIGVNKNQTCAVTAVEDKRAAEGRYYLARIVGTPYQNPAEFMHAGERFEKDVYIAKTCAKICWLRCTRRGVVRSYKEESTHRAICR
jgi:hypothetical protein